LERKMPLYEYHCDDCGYEFEAIVPFTRADEMTCESCGSTKMIRLASTFCSAVEGGTGAVGQATPPPCYSGG
jgi:putative FmdB family regulatory protein